MIYFYICAIGLFIAGHYCLKYLNGGYTFTDEIIEEGDILRNKDNKMIGKWFIIRRTYKNGRIKIINKEFRN